MAGTFRFNPACCCGCKPREIARQTIRGEGTWDLTPYQGDGTGTGNQFWRLRNNFMGWVHMQQGCINADARLLGLPDSISSDTYKYTWIFILEAGCPDLTHNQIVWPTGERSSFFEC